MALTPFCDDYWHGMDYCNSRFFEDISCPKDFYGYHHSHWWHPWYHRRCLATKVCVGNDGFQVTMDVKHFKANEITVKTLDDVVVIEGKTKSKEDEYVCIARQFIRKYKLPRGYDPGSVVCSLSDGILSVKAPPPAKMPEINERIVQIQEPGQKDLSGGENQDERGGDGAKV